MKCQVDVSFFIDGDRVRTNKVYAQYVPRLIFCFLSRQVSIFFGPFFCTLASIANAYKKFTVLAHTRPYHCARECHLKTGCARVAQKMMIPNYRKPWFRAPGGFVHHPPKNPDICLRRYPQTVNPNITYMAGKLFSKAFQPCMLCLPKRNI